MALTPAGRALVDQLAPEALRVTNETLAPLTATERATLTDLLERLK